MNLHDDPVLQHYAGSKVLVTGGLGFLGSRLVQTLGQVPCQIDLLVRPGRDTNPVPAARATVKLIQGDIQIQETWSKALDGVDYVFHFAAQTSASVANQDPLTDFGINVEPVLHMLETCRRKGLKPSILFSGTVTQAGIPPRLPVDESFQDLPIIVYDIHKLMAEKYLQYYCQDAGIPAVTLRLANVYGPGASVGSQNRGILNLMIRNGLKNEPLTVYGKGEWVRDYLFIDDAVGAFLLAGNAATNIGGNYYVIGSGTGTRIVDAINLVADRVQHHGGHRPEVVHVPPPESSSPIEDRNFVADTGKFRSATGWQPQVSLADGIDRTISYFTSHVDARVAASP
jgi:nucleoside-diphosphate-sugar epimerase